jgi:hypothetical protein
MVSGKQRKRPRAERVASSTLQSRGSLSSLSLSRPVSSSKRLRAGIRGIVQSSAQGQRVERQRGCCPQAGGGLRRQLVQVYLLKYSCNYYYKNT